MSPAKKKATTRAKARGRATAPATGSIVREYKGKTHRVKVTDDGYRYAGETYRSLTAIAKVITGAPSISGPRFFGLDRDGGAR